MFEEVRCSNGDLYDGGLCFLNRTDAGVQKSVLLSESVPSAEFSFDSIVLKPAPQGVTAERVISFVPNSEAELDIVDEDLAHGFVQADNQMDLSNNTTDNSQTAVNCTGGQCTVQGA